MATNTEMMIHGVMTPVTGMTHSAQEIDAAVDKANNALARDGSNAMTGALKFNNFAIIHAYAYGLLLDVLSTDGDYANRYSLWLKSRDIATIENALLFYDGTTDQSYPVLHTRNKPSGSYTGNGDATERVIPIGGIGGAVLVVGGGSAVIVTSAGAFGGAYDGQPKYFTNAQCSAPQNGDLVIRSADNGLNGTGLEYKYYRL